MIRVAVIHEDTLLRLSIRQVLENTPDIQVVGDAGTGQAGIQCAQTQQPHVVILGLKLPDIKGTALTTQLLNLQPAPKILFISLDPQQVIASQLLRTGALGFLTPRTSPNELIGAIKTVNDNEACICEEIIQHLKSTKISDSPPPSTALNELTDREKEVLILLAQGKTISEMADQLSINHKTVHSYRNRICEKLHAKNDVALTLLAIREGLVTIDKPTD